MGDPINQDKGESTKQDLGSRPASAGTDSDTAASSPSSPVSETPSKHLEVAATSEKADASGSGHPTPGIKPEGGSERRDPEVQVPYDETENLPPAIPVPRLSRRGLFAAVCLMDEVDEPKHYTRPQKWWITFVVALASVAAPIGSNILLPSLVEISEDFHSSPTVTNLAIALYMAALGIFPVFWSSFSESLGRRTVYVVSFLLLAVFNVLSAVSVNIAMFLVMRILSGGASGSVQAVGAGTIADIWHVKERGNAMYTYYLGPLMGPLLAPIIGGALQLRFGWRSTMWFNVIYGGLTFLFLLFGLPETLKHMKPFGVKELKKPATGGDGHALTRISSRQSLKIKSKMFFRIMYGVFVEPLLVLRYLRFPAVLATIYYASITFGSLYFLQISIQNTFTKPPYSFSTLEIGLTYIPNSVGYAVSSLFAGRWTDKIMAREARKAGRIGADGRLIYRPEDRMKENVWLAAMLYPCALLWWGWAADKHVFWFAAVIANFFFGIGSMIVFGTVTTMLTEFMPDKAASAIGLNNLCRMVTSAVGIVVAQPLLDAIGTGWTFTAIFILAIASSSIIWAMKHYGPRWRADMERKLKESNEA